MLGGASASRPLVLGVAGLLLVGLTMFLVFVLPGPERGGGAAPEPGESTVAQDETDPLEQGTSRSGPLSQLSVDDPQGEAPTREISSVPESASDIAEFTVTGRVLGETPLADASVTVFAVDGDGRTEVGIIDVPANGSFGPEVIALDDSEQYVFRLEGAAWAVEEVAIDPPQPGGEVEVVFEAQPGEVMWFLVVDYDTGANLNDASVEVSWEHGGRTTTLRREPRADGYVEMLGCRAGKVRATGMAAGYAAQTLELEIPLPSPTTYVLELWPRKQLTGRVVAGGEPVTDFGVAICEAGKRSFARTYFFEDREDGSFELEGAPPGDCELVAFVEGAQSEPVTVAEADVGAEILLELAEPCAARGRVVEQATGAPIVTATVQVFASIQGDRTHPLGPPVAVEADGSFELASVFDGGSEYTVAAPGFSPITNTAIGRPGEVADLGTIALTPTRTLTIRLESDVQLDPTQFSVSTTDSDRIPPTHFDENLEVVVPDMGVGPIFLSIQTAEWGSFATYDTLSVTEDEWLIVVPIGGPCRLEVEVENPPGGWDRQRYVHAVRWAGSEYFDVIGPIEDGFVGLDLPCDDYTVQLDASVTDYDPKPVSFADERTQRIRLTRRTDTFHVRVVDADGAPISGATVVVEKPGAEAPPYRTTDAAGLAEFNADGVQQELAVCVWHEVRGAVGDLTLSLGGGPDEQVEVVLDPRSSVEVVLMDGDVPAPRFECFLVDRALNTSLALGVQTTGPDGRARFERVGAGTYDMVASREGYEAVRVKVSTFASEPEVVAVRRKSP